jgi:hypothetical protein
MSRAILPPRPGSRAVDGRASAPGWVTSCSPIGWGLLGAVLALLLRSPAAALGVGLAYALPFELVVTSAWTAGQPWLPGQLLRTLAEDGSPAVAYGRAALVLTIYGTVAVVIAATLFARRSVKTCRRAAPRQGFNSLGCKLMEEHTVGATRVDLFYCGARIVSLCPTPWAGPTRSCPGPTLAR